MKSDRNRNFTEFGMRLYKLMKERGENYKDLYQLLRPDMKNFEPDDLKDSDNNALRRIRNRMTGKTKISLEELIVLANHYGVSIDYLIGRDDAETGLSAEAIQVLKSIDEYTKEHLSAVLKNRDCVQMIADTAYHLLAMTFTYTNSYRWKGIDKESTPPDILEQHDKKMSQARIYADAEIFRAVSKLGETLRSLYPLEREYLYPEK